jgi:hypothetical protein
MTVDPVAQLFPFGSPEFLKLVEDIRHRIFEEVAASNLPGMIFTYVWTLDDPADKAHIDGLVQIFTRRNAQVCFVELEATQAERLSRNETPLRLAEKKTKRDIENSRAHLIYADRTHRLNSRNDFFYPDRHLKIENTNLAPETVAEQVIEHFGLRTYAS